MSRFILIVSVRILFEGAFSLRVYLSIVKNIFKKNWCSKAKSSSAFRSNEKILQRRFQYIKTITCTKGLYFTYEQAFKSTNKFWKRWITTQPAFTCSKLTMETMP